MIFNINTLKASKQERKMKKCKKCLNKEVKKDGYCHDCYKEYMRTYMRKRYEKRRNDFIESQGGKCAICESSKNLEIAHKKREKGNIKASQAIGSMSNKRLQEELEKCFVLCESCRKEKTRKERTTWKHGTITGYKHCKCGLCKKANADYKRELAQRNK